MCQRFLGLLDIDDTTAHTTNESCHQLKEDDLALCRCHAQLLFVLLFVSIRCVALDSCLERAAKLVLTVCLHLERASLGSRLVSLGALGREESVEVDESLERLPR